MTYIDYIKLAFQMAFGFLLVLFFVIMLVKLVELLFDK